MCACLSVWTRFFLITYQNTSCMGKGYLHVIVNNNPVNVASSYSVLREYQSAKPGCVNTSLMLAYSKQIKKIILYM